MNKYSLRRWVGCSTTLISLLALNHAAIAAPPVVKTVPWVASNPLIPHDTWSGKVITLKGTSSQQGATITYTWDFGDGSPVVTGPVNTTAIQYAIQATHAYAGAVGTVYSATLTVANTATAESASQKYYVVIQNKTLQVEVNVALDEGLWYLHKTQTRSGSDGYWSTYNYVAQTAANVNAFEVNGHVETGDPNNPYTETVTRGMRYIFPKLVSEAIAVSPHGGNPDSNGNGIGVKVNQSDYTYQGGHLMDAIIASGTPDALAPTGPANVIGRKYKDIIQDMVDSYAYGQYDYNIGGSAGIDGGWVYTWNSGTDNSANQWAAIGLIAAERNWGAVLPAWVKTYNANSLDYTKGSGVYLGTFGYTAPNYFVWGTYATTPSGMVQCAMDGIGRGNPLWDNAETYLRDRFGNSTAGGATGSIKRNYYGLFSFVKSMLLHDSNGDGVAEPIHLLHSMTAGVPDIDWYLAQAAPYGTDPTHGVARQLILDQLADGSWNNSSYNYYSYQAPQTTAYAIIMLQRTLFEAGGPVAVAKANPNPAVAGQIIQLDGSDSFQQDASKLIDSWEWDLDNNGTYDVSGPFPTVSFPAVGNYPVKLRVSDNSSPEKFADTTITILVTTPPIAPTADAGGSYSLCPGAKPWFLNGIGSNNPDEGQSEPGQPANTIVAYEWDLDGDGQYDDATGALPDVTAFFTAKGPGSYLIQLKVTDNTAASFPSSQQPNLSDTDTAVVTVRASTDPVCTCVDNLAARAKPGKVQLTWTHSGAHHYNIYRGTLSGGPYLKIASTTSTYSTYLDQSVVNGTTYFYVIREANLLNEESCQSNEASAKPTTR